MKDRHLLRAWALLALAAATPKLVAQEEVPDSVPAAPIYVAQEPASKVKQAATAFEKLEAEYDAAYQEWVATVMAMTDEERKKGYPDRPGPEYFPRFRKLAEAGDIGAKAWCLNNVYQAGMEPGQIDKMRGDLLRELAQHPGSAKAVEAVANGLMYDWSMSTQDAEAILLKLIKESKHHDALGSAHFALAQVYMRDTQEGSQKKAIAVLHVIDEKYQDTFYGKYAKGLIFEAENLQVGMTAPNFSGKDGHDAEISLADYRGKVTLIVFWGFW